MISFPVLIVPAPIGAGFVATFRDVDVPPQQASTYSDTRQAAAEALAEALAKYVIRDRVPPRSSAVLPGERPMPVPAASLAYHCLVMMSRGFQLAPEVVAWLREAAPTEPERVAALTLATTEARAYLGKLHKDMTTAARARAALMRDIEAAVSTQTLMASEGVLLPADSTRAALDALDLLDAHVSRLDSVIGELDRLNPTGGEDRASAHSA